MQPENPAPTNTNTPDQTTSGPVAPGVATAQTPDTPAEATYSPYPDLGGTATPSTQPVISSSNLVGLTGSQVKPQKERLPLGIYLIAAFTFAGLVVGFFDTSQNSNYYSIAMLVDLFIAIGLLLRLEAARKTMLVISGILLILTTVSLIMLASLQSRINNAQSRFDQARANLDLTRLTTEQKSQLEKIQTDLRAQKKLAGKAIQLTYIKLGITALETVAVVVYLTRPKVKQVFRTLE